MNTGLPYSWANHFPVPGIHLHPEQARLKSSGAGISHALSQRSEFNYTFSTELVNHLESAIHANTHRFAGPNRLGEPSAGQGGTPQDQQGKYPQEKTLPHRFA